MSYQISTELDPAGWAEEYRRDSRCRVHEFLTAAAAAEMVQAITGNARFRQAHIADGEYRELSREEFSSLPPAQRQQLVRNVYTLATRGVGFWYGRHGINPGTKDALGEIYQWLSSDETLRLVRQISGIPTLGAPSAQLTAFGPGDFLTRHRDDVTSERRKIAFVLNLTEGWHPDWGGLLQFFHDSGETRDSWSPLFNSLCLFDVKHVHSVTCVAPFAPRARLAISGWFHDHA